MWFSPAYLIFKTRSITAIILRRARSRAPYPPTRLNSARTSYQVIDMVDVGEKTPELTLFDMNLKQRSLKEFRGKKLILAFFPGAFTSVCKKEMCTLRDDLVKLEKLDAQVVGVSVNDPFSLRGFHEDNALNFPLLSDYTREAIKIYGVELPNFAGLEGYTVAKRSVFVIDREGVLRWKWVSDNPGKEPDYAEIRIQLEKF